MAGLVALYCARDAVAAHEGPCLTAALVRRHIERMNLPGVIPGPKEYEARAAVDLAAWKDAGEALCEAKLPGCQRMAPILASAAEAMRDAREPMKALAMTACSKSARPAALARVAVHIASYDAQVGAWSHINKVLTPWMEKKEQAIEEASDSYLPVLSIEPAAPPKWIVAAAARVGLMWSDFIDELRAVPVPPDWRRGARSLAGAASRMRSSAPRTRASFRDPRTA